MDVVRQGDVLLKRINRDELPGNVKQVEPTPDGKVILALGEKTGHHHRFHGPQAVMFREDGSGGGLGGYTAVELTEPLALVHEEHAAITLPAGLYEQAFQVEYKPEALQRVAD